MPTSARNGVTSPLKLQDKRHLLARSELPGISEELEEMYNTLALQGRTPSDKIFKLIRWLAQEAEVLKDPEYDPTFKCDVCGFGSS